MTKMLNAALDLVERGIQVLPLCWPVDGQCGCGRGHTGRDIGKAPLLGAGWHKEPSPPEDVRKWWTDWPRANIGIRVEHSALVVIDTDSPEAEAEVQSLGVPPTAKASTGRGFHYYFKRNGSTAGRKTGWGDSQHIDVLAKGFVVAPPSVHQSGSVYTWESSDAPADLPLWALPILDPPRAAPRSLPMFDDSVDMAEVRSALDAIDPDCDHDTWVQVGMALHSIDPALGLGEWDAWSSRGAKYDAGVVTRKWDSFNGSGVTKSTLFRFAMDAGWRAAPKWTPTPGAAHSHGKAPPPPDTGPLRRSIPLHIEAGNTRWEFGDTVLRIKATMNAKGEVDEECTPIAQAVVPIARTRDAEDGAHGVAYRYRTHEGRERDAVCPAGAWVGDRASSNAFAKEAAAEGVKIYPGNGALLGLAMGQWALHAADAPTMTSVIRPGWHDEGRVYVNGPSVHGAEWIYQGPKIRGETRGTLDEWRDGVAELATTRGLLLALGVAFAGPLIALLRRPSWMVHYHTNSSRGKTVAAGLAASVWYAQKHIAKWNGTAIGIEHLLEGYSGSVIVLDEFKDTPPKLISELVHRISDNAGRVRSNQSGSANLRRESWAVTAFSTGEISIADALGHRAQGGHLVRGMDIRLDYGDSTTSRDHAHALEDFCREQYGTAGDAWAAWLVAHPDARRRCSDLADYVMDQCSTGIEDGEALRILRQIAVAGAALIEANAADIWRPNLRDSQSAEDLALDAVRWAIDGIVTERGDVISAEARALRTLTEMMESSPGMFPHETDVQGCREVVGILAHGKLHTTEGMLKSCPKFMAAGVGPRTFLRWMELEGRASQTRQTTWRLGGIHSRWWVLDMGGEDDAGF